MSLLGSGSRLIPSKRKPPHKLPRKVRRLARTERLRWRIGKALEVTSAAAVVALGLLLLTGQIGKV